MPTTDNPKNSTIETTIQKNQSNNDKLRTNELSSSPVNDDISSVLSYSLSIYSLVQQVISAQKGMRRSAALLVTFTSVCAVLYIDIPGIISVGLGSLLGTDIKADSQAIRFIAGMILFYYIVIFGTNYYKGLNLLDEAYNLINTTSDNLSGITRKIYSESLSDNYLFDAMRKLIGVKADDLDNNEPQSEKTQSEKTLSEKTQSEKTLSEKSQSEVTENEKTSESKKFDEFSDKIRISVALIVVVTFICLTLFGEYLVMLTLIGIGSEHSNFDEFPSLSRLGFGLLIFASAFFAVLSFLFFSFLSTMYRDRDKFSRERALKYFSVGISIMQFIIFLSISSQANTIKLMHYGCKIGDEVKFIAGNQVELENIIKENKIAFKKMKYINGDEKLKLYNCR